MKTLALAALAALLTSPLYADSVARNNVACDGGSVYGFTVRGYGLTHYVAEKNLPYCPESTVGVPSSVDIYEPTEVVAWLESEGVEITEVRLRGKRTIRREIEVLDSNGNPIPVLDSNGDPVLDADGNPVNETITRTSSRKPANGGW